jgi:hypothetical protein
MGEIRIYTDESVDVAIAQGLQRINPIQTRHRPGNLISFGHKEIFESTVISGYKFYGADLYMVAQ